MLTLHRIPAFRDNYVWLLADSAGHCLVVDPGDAAPVEAFLAERELTLQAILVTHHHADHVGGVAQLSARHDAPVYGPAQERIPALTQPLDDGDVITLDRPAAAFHVLHVPGHTLGHIAFHCPEEKLLFCGDTLFAGGCGRLFEGTPAQMHDSLRRLAALPDDTRVCCAHEYTCANLEFAFAVMPDDAAVRARLDAVREQRMRDEATVPSVLGVEKLTNPFLRTDEPGLAAVLAARAGHALADPVERFAVLRAWKDTF